MKQAARSGFCFVLVLGMKLCTHDSTAQLCPQTSATVESRFHLGSDLWLQARHSVADDEAFMRRPLETPKENRPQKGMAQTKSNYRRM